MRLIDHLKALGLDNRSARDAMATGKVRVGGVPTADPARAVDPADVHVDPRAPRMRVGRDLFVLRRDAHLAVVVKPPGMLAVPAPRRTETNAIAELGRMFGASHPVHRLDEGTSGLMLVAHDAETQVALKAQFEVHSVERSYVAIGWGRAPHAHLRTWLVRDRGDGLRGSGPATAPGAKEAITRFEPIGRLGGASMCRATLETGRTHQVRIHAAESGFPLLGDPLYAPPHVARRHPRVALHAAVLGFDHPITGERWRFEIPLADDLEALARALASAPQRGRSRG